MAIDADLKALATGKNFAAITTLMPSGQPQTQIIWVDADEEHVLINTEVHRQKFKNIAADPRVTVTVFDVDDPYRYIEVRGRVVDTETGPAARESIDDLARKYTGNDYGRSIQSERVIVRITPERINKYGL